jgi:outer membrane protein assembly factor BamB
VLPKSRRDSGAPAGAAFPGIAGTSSGVTITPDGVLLTEEPRMERLRTVPLALAGVLFAWGASVGSDWTRWRGPEGTGISAENDWKPLAVASPKVKWKMNVGVGHSSFSVAGKALYTMGNVAEKDIIYCLDAETGKETWRFSYPCASGNYKGTRATPVLDGDSLYTLGRDGDAHCLDAKTGKVKWQTNLMKQHGSAAGTWGMAGSPLILGAMVVYNARAAGLALDKATGKKVWETGGGPCGYASPVAFKLGAKECLAVFGNQEITVTDATNGKRVFSHPWKTQYDVNAADPVFFDNKLFITSGYEHGCALLDVSGKNIKELWTNLNMRGHFASPIYLDGHLYGVDGNTGTGQLKCLDAKTGQVKWSQGGSFENLMMAAGKIIAVDKKGDLVVAEASPAGYKEIARGVVLNGQTTNWTAPVLANGLIYCRNSEGDVVCVDVR